MAGDDFITTNVPRVVESLERFKRDQVPFATALALTRTAQDAQKEIKRQLPTKFTLRRRWVELGIRIRKATKRDLESVVFSRDAFLLKQEQGATKRRAAIPVRVRRSERSVPSRAKWPSQLLRRPDVFIRDLLGGARGVFQKMRSGRLKLLWVIEDKTVTKPRLRFGETVRTVVRKRWVKNFGAALARAIRTAR